ncbi:MAG: hypothetical protein EOR74_31680 [Mesorhizobium sp.]|nr:MAG: hypothetical protein EOR74_31680 [Mesorhizobium sp.]
MQLPRRLSPCNVEDWRKRSRHLISPLEGEMVGRPEGGTTGRGAPLLALPAQAAVIGLSGVVSGGRG